MCVCTLDQPPFLTEKWIGEKGRCAEQNERQWGNDRDCRIVSAWQQTRVRDATYERCPRSNDIYYFIIQRNEQHKSERHIMRAEEATRTCSWQTDSRLHYKNDREMQRPQFNIVDCRNGQFFKASGSFCATNLMRDWIFKVFSRRKRNFAKRYIISPNFEQMKIEKPTFKGFWPSDFLGPKKTVVDKVYAFSHI